MSNTDTDAANELVTINERSALELYTTQNGLDPILQKISDAVASFDVDATTESGRKKIASVAYKIAKSKTLLDNLGKSLTEEWAKNKKLVDFERKRVREFLDNLKMEFRKPLTAFEESEQERVAYLRARVETIDDYGVHIDCALYFTVEQLRARLVELENLEITDDFQEFMQAAAVTKRNAAKTIEAAIEKRVFHDEQELKKLADAEEKRKKYEQDAAAIVEQRLKDAVENERKQARQREIELQQNAEMEKKRANEREIKLKQQAKLAKKKAKALELAEKHRKKAAEDEEKKRIEKEAALEKNRDRVHSAVVIELMAIGVGNLNTAIMIRDAILNCEISTLSINYGG